MLPYIVIITRQSMPYKVRAILHYNEDGSYTVLVNDNHTPERQWRGVLHELHHIQRGDFSSEEPVHVLETLAHEVTERDVDLTEFTFYYI